MNIEQAKAIPISEILDKLNFKPAKRQSGPDLYYLSPFRNEKTASFHVNTNKNVWYDHGTGEGGDAITFIQKWMSSTGEDGNVPDALRWARKMFGYAAVVPRVVDQDERPAEPKLKIINKRKITRPALVEYLDSRGIPIKIADEYLQQVDVENKDTGKKFFAIGFKNEKGGFELRNRNYKGSTKPKYITYIRGTESWKRDGIHFFEGWTDYLSAIIQQQNGQKFPDDTIVLNSLSNLAKGSDYIKGFGYRTAYTWMDNDEPGRKATAALGEFFATQNTLLHKPMNALYAPYKDVNAWHMVKLGLAA